MEGTLYHVHPVILSAQQCIAHNILMHRCAHPVYRYNTPSTAMVGTRLHPVGMVSRPYSSLPSLVWHVPSIPMVQSLTPSSPSIHLHIMHPDISPSCHISLPMYPSMHFMHSGRAHHTVCYPSLLPPIHYTMLHVVLVCPSCGTTVCIPYSRHALRGIR